LTIGDTCFNCQYMAAIRQSSILDAKAGIPEKGILVRLRLELDQYIKRCQHV